MSDCSAESGKENKQLITASAVLEAKGEWNVFSLDLRALYRETVTGRGVESSLK